MVLPYPTPILNPTQTPLCSLVLIFELHFPDPNSHLNILNAAEKAPYLNPHPIPNPNPNVKMLFILICYGALNMNANGRKHQIGFWCHAYWSSKPDV